MDHNQFFQDLWQDLTLIAPQAAAIHRALSDAGETVHNDHVAFRTLNRSPVNLDQLERHILGFGYEALADYQFPHKHLRARAYLLPGAPRIFLSELILDELSEQSQRVLDRCVSQVDSSMFNDPTCFYAGRPWDPLTFTEYAQLAMESEYGAWVAALGYHANHFTVSVNHLNTLCSVEAVLEFVEQLGYSVNSSGGRVKGSRALLLEQGSTLADRLAVQFADGTHVIPTCYSEFAQRYFDGQGRLYEGFVTDSADRIFESTHLNPRSPD